MRVWLAAQALTLDDFEAGLENALLVERFKDHLAREQAAGHFEANRDRYAQARLRHIVVASEGAARELLALLRDEGADFAELAREHSLHPSRSAGGDLGLVPRAALAPALAEAVFAARAGDVVGPFPTEMGFQLVAVEALVPGTFDEPTAAAIRKELFDAWLAERLRDARIDLSCLEGA